MKFFAGVLYQVYLNLVSSVLKKLKTSIHKAQFWTFLYVRLEMKKKTFQEKTNKSKEIKYSRIFFSNPHGILSIMQDSIFISRWNNKLLQGF